ncbi:MAG: sigma-70 family RNA polymerase sigma factor [Clostridium sp.]|nr:sigma-70 family RNA polymerase sigma factor [Clostridium sp.]
MVEETLSSENEIQNWMIESLREGSIEAFNAIYGLYSRRLLIYIAKATRNKEDAEEIVHDIFIGLWNLRKGIKPGTNLAALLFSIAYKRRVDYFRRALNAPIYEDYMNFHNELVAEDSANLEYDDFYNMFERALRTLPPRLQSFIVLSRIKGLEVEEIAQKLNVSPKTVSNGLSEGLKALRNRLVAIMKNNKS